MPITIDRARLLELIDQGAQLAGVLPADEYRDEHLPDALHLPLKMLTAESASVLDAASPWSSTAGTGCET